ncbi:MAG: hypothetical protein MI724_15445 [Spirochaetales bacterium]|nr:hypothetical protein [Spirochaetales bacterium]
MSVLAEYYEILVYNETTQVTSGVLESGGSHTISVPVGTFDVLVLAGTGQLEFPYLIGLGESEGIVVESGLTTNVPIGLDTYSWTTTWPSNPSYTGEDATVSVDLVLPISATVGPVDSSHRLNFQGSFHYFTWQETGASQLTGTATFTLPASEGTFGLDIQSDIIAITFADDDYALSGALGSYTTASWRFPSRFTFAPESVMYAEFSYDVTTVANPTGSGVNVDVTWNP